LTEARRETMMRTGCKGFSSVSIPDSSEFRDSARAAQTEGELKNSGDVGVPPSASGGSWKSRPTRRSGCSLTTGDNVTSVETVVSDLEIDGAIMRISSAHLSRTFDNIVMASGMNIATAVIMKIRMLLPHLDINSKGQ
jgi:hypothetical protein